MKWHDPADGITVETIVRGCPEGGVSLQVCMTFSNTFQAWHSDEAVVRMCHRSKKMLAFGGIPLDSDETVKTDFRTVPQSPPPPKVRLFAHIGPLHFVVCGSGGSPQPVFRYHVS